jgi:hypothetical protein
MGNALLPSYAKGLEGFVRNSSEGKAQASLLLRKILPHAEADAYLNAQVLVKLLVYEALSYLCMRPEATSV